MAGSRVLELGPLEGGHTHQLHAAGADIVAVEAQARAYLKCLIVKEPLGMPRARFLLGDFAPYLRSTEERFDLCFASGVLYHMRNPVETIALTAKVATKLFLWTHVYDEDVITRSELLAPRFPGREPATHQGFTHNLHRFNYAEALHRNGFCGGSAPYSNWLTRTDLLAALEHFGWAVTNIGFDTPGHPHGPALVLTATQTD